MTTSPRRTLITGAARPLAIELVRRCLMRGDSVIAAARNPARVPILADLRAQFGGLELLALDPADAASVAEAMPVLERITTSLDLLVIGPAEAGARDRDGDVARDAVLSSVSATGLVEHYRRHAVAPVLLVRTLLPWLTHREGARVLVVTSDAASVAGKISGGNYAASASGAGLHMLTRALAHDVAEQRITVCLGNPGRADLRMDEEGGASSVEVSAEDAALGLLTVTDRLSPERSGAHVDYTGTERAW